MSGPRIVCNDYETEQGIIDHFVGWVVTITLPESGALLYGRKVSVVVTGHAIGDEYVTLEGNVWSDELSAGDPEQPFSWEWHELEQVEIC